MEKMSRYLKSLFACLLVMSMLLATACNGGDNPGTDTNSNDDAQVVVGGNVVDLPPLSSKVTNKTVKFLTHKKPDVTGETNATSEYIKQYGITVEYITVTQDALQNRLIQMIASDTAPDLVDGTDTSPVKTLVKNNLVQPVDDLIDFSNSVWDSVRTPTEKSKINGKTYRVVQKVTFANMVWYNTKMFKELGLKDPGYYYDRNEWTVERLFDLATKLTIDKNNDGTPDQYGFGGHEIQYMLLGATGESFLMYDAKGNYKNNLSSPRVAQAMNTMQDMWFKYKFRPSGKDNEFTSIMNNKLAMGYFGQWFAVTAKGADARIAAGDLSWVPAPTFANGPRTYYGAIEDRYIAAGAKNPEGAAAVLTYEQYRYIQGNEAKKKGETKEIATPEMVKRFIDNIQYINSSPDFRELPGTSQWSEEIFKRVWAMVPWSTTVEEFSPMLDAAITNANKQ